MESTRTPLPADLLDRLVAAGTQAWAAHADSGDDVFQRHVMADFRAAHDALTRATRASQSFLELGSGIGMIAIIADLLGFDAYGIELRSALVDESEQLAERFGSRATFVEGSFVPREYQEEVELLSPDFDTLVDGADAYAELGMQLSDFDLVYVYPWPGEEDWLHELVRRHAGEQTRLLSYSIADGFVVTTPSA